METGEAHREQYQTYFTHGESLRLHTFIYRLPSQGPIAEDTEGSTWTSARTAGALKNRRTHRVYT